MSSTILFAVAGSHPSAAVQEALRIKRVRHRRIDLLPVINKPLVAARFGSPTVPAVRFADGERVQGSRAIMRALDARVPDPPLVTGDPEADRAEAWGDEVLQPLVRRLTWSTLREQPEALPSYLADTRPRLPLAVTRLVGPTFVRAALAVHGERAGDAGEVPVCMDRIDAWIASGTLGGPQPTAADLQIGSSVRLLLTIDAFASEFGHRPAAAHARRHFPHYPGHIPAASPAAG